MHYLETCYSARSALSAKRASVWPQHELTTEIGPSLTDYGKMARFNMELVIVTFGNYIHFNWRSKAPKPSCSVSLRK